MAIVQYTYQDCKCFFCLSSLTLLRFEGAAGTFPNSSCPAFLVTYFFSPSVLAPVNALKIDMHSFRGYIIIGDKERGIECQKTHLRPAFVQTSYVSL